MSVERSELHELIDSLADDQVSVLLADVRQRTASVGPVSDAAFAWIGIGTTKGGETDVAANADRYLDGFGADSQ